MSADVDPLICAACGRPAVDPHPLTVNPIHYICGCVRCCEGDRSDRDRRVSRHTCLGSGVSPSVAQGIGLANLPPAEPGGGCGAHDGRVVGAAGDKLLLSPGETSDRGRGREHVREYVEAVREGAIADDDQFDHKMNCMNRGCPICRRRIRGKLGGIHA